MLDTDLQHKDAQKNIFNRAMIEILNEDWQTGRNRIWRKIWDAMKNVDPQLRQRSKYRFLTRIF